MIKIENYSIDNLGLLLDFREYLLSIRNSVPHNLKAGINYSVILYSAIIFEAEMECLLHPIVNYYEEIYIKQSSSIDGELLTVKNINRFLNNSFKNAKQEISKNTGFKHYKNMLSQLIDNYQTTAKMQQLNEGINTLFELRNVIAHGRAVTYEVKTYMPFPTYNTEKVEEDYKGGYKFAEDYLLKKKLIKIGDSGTHNLNSILTDVVCNHFVEIQKQYIRECKNSIPKVFCLE